MKRLMFCWKAHFSSLRRFGVRRVFTGSTANQVIDLNAALTRWASSRPRSVQRSLSRSWLAATVKKFVMTAGALPPAPEPIVLRQAYCRALLGVDISKGDIEDALRRLELTQAGKDDGSTAWKVPSYRLDLCREVDLIEEVARIIGIERIHGKLLASPAPSSSADRFYDFQMDVRQALCGLGFSEARTSTLVSDSMVWSNGEPLRLRNPLGEDQAFLRTSLLPGLLAALRRNIRHGAKSVRLYELGRTFHTAENEEVRKLAFIIYGEAVPPSWRGDKARRFRLARCQRSCRGIDSTCGGVHAHRSKISHGIAM